MIGMMGICPLCFGQQAKGQEYNRQFRLARELEGAGQWERAREIYETLYEQDRENLVLFQRLRELFVRAGDYERATALIEERRERHPEDLQLDVSLALMEYKMGRRDEAMEEWQKILDRHPESSSVYHLVASAMIEERLLDEAVDVYLLGRVRIGQAGLFAYNLAMLYGGRMEYGKATEEFLVYLKSQPKRLSLVESQLLRFPRTERVVDEMTGRIQEAMRAQPHDAGLLRLLASVLIRAERFEEALDASRQLEALAEEEKKGEALFLFGQKTFLSGHLEEAKDAYGIIEREVPEFPHMDQVLFGIAQCYEAEEDFDKAAAYYQNVYDGFSTRPAAPQALYRKGVLERDRLHRFETAAETFQILADRFPLTQEGQEGHLGVATCAVMQGDLERAETLFRRVMEERKIKDCLWVRGLTGLSDAAFYGGRFDESLSLLDGLTRKDIDINAIKEPGFNDGLKRRLFLKEHYRRVPEILGVLAEGEWMAVRGRHEEAIRILDSLDTAWPHDPLAAHALFKKGEMAIGLKRLDDGKASFDTLLSRFPDDLLADRAMERIGWIHEERKQWSQAVARYEALLTEYPQSFLADEIRRRIRRIEGEAR